MGKELECLDRIDKRNYLTEREHKEFLGVVEKAIKEYEAIKNADSTKALECLEWITSSLLGKYELFYEEKSLNEKEYKESVDCIKDDYNTIKQALLKAQEPKQYLKWEDLEFKEETQEMKVLLNGEKYILKYANEWFCGWCNKVQITNGTYILCTLGNGMNQFFNDLHLERVEE